MLSRAIQATKNPKLLLLALSPILLWAEPAPQQRPEPTATFANYLAQQHFRDFGSPTVVRRDDNLTDCAPLNEYSGGVQVASQEVLTEFVYSLRWVCVSMYTPPMKSESGQRIARFKLDASSRVLGNMVGGEFLERQRLGIRFPSNPAEVPGKESLDDFVARLPKALNLGRVGALESVVRHMESGAGASSPAPIVETVRPNDNAQAAPEVKEIPLPPPALAAWLPNVALLVSILSLIAVTAFLIRARLQLQKVAKAEAEPVSRVREVTELLATSWQVPAKADPNARQSLAFTISSVQDQKSALVIDSLLNELPKNGVTPAELNELITIARNMHAWAVKDKVASPLDVVKIYLSDKLDAAKKNAKAPPRKVLAKLSKPPTA